MEPKFDTGEMDMKRIEEVICYVERRFTDSANLAASAVNFMKNMNKRRQGDGIINDCAASVGRESLTHEKAASRNRDVFCKDFLGRRVLPNTNHVSPGPQGHFSNHIRHQPDMAFSPDRKDRMGYHSKWLRAYFVPNDEDYCGGSYLPVYC